MSAWKWLNANVSCWKLKEANYQISCFTQGQTFTIHYLYSCWHIKKWSSHSDLQHLHVPVETVRYWVSICINATLKRCVLCGGMKAHCCFLLYCCLPFAVFVSYECFWSICRQPSGTSPQFSLVFFVRCKEHGQVGVWRSDISQGVSFKSENVILECWDSLIGFISEGLRNSNEGYLNAITIVSDSNSALPRLFRATLRIYSWHAGFGMV